MLKYLFTALHNDGTIVEQTQEDKSKTTEHGSAFTDVQARITDVQQFALGNENLGVLVDLTDGRFELNGQSFYMYDKEVINRRLIYFRRNIIEMTPEFQEQSHKVVYAIGWQGNDPITGENIQRIMYFE